MKKKEIVAWLKSRPSILKRTELLGPEGQLDARKSEKLHEVAGFAEIILRYLQQFPPKNKTLTVLECSCGKSYMGFILSFLLPEVCSKKVRLIGIDFDEKLIERCREIADGAGLSEVCSFECRRIIEYRAEMPLDVVISLHACDTATDEALVQGIRSGAEFVHAVPCCQNQIRGQIKSGHPVENMTRYGPVRYRLANLLTDALRAEFMNAAGYYVEMHEIGSPKLTPKNLCICCRKVRSKSAGSRDGGYRHLRDVFGVKPAIEKLCPGVIGD